MSFECFSEEAATYRLNRATTATTATTKRSQCRVQKENRPKNKNGKQPKQKKGKQPLKKPSKVKRVTRTMKWIISK